MNIRQLASKKNLELAWRRITTGGNQPYKRFFRDVYYAYEIALTENLADLRERLLGGTFSAQSPERVYFPKPSGLHRPIGLLHIEDQIVLQAFANLAAKKMYRRRESLQFKVVFSNILQKKDSIFFVKRWQETYKAFQRSIERLFNNGFVWVADFDLAAFYDTISHHLLMKTIYPRTEPNDAMRWMQRCLSAWSSVRDATSLGHGLPQGPIASDFLAECFLLPVDEKMKNLVGYVRYVDDVRIFGRTENDVRRQVVELEKSCRERGLIPQTGKYEIKRAKSARDAQGMLPSISEPEGGPRKKSLEKRKAKRLFESAISGKPQKVTDKTRARYVLFRTGPDSRILNLVVRLTPRCPEHADAFFYYLQQYNYRKKILDMCTGLLDESPYPYVRGEAWHLVSRYLHERGRLPGNLRRVLTDKAIQVVRNRNQSYFMERWGACHFLAVCESLGFGDYCRWLTYQTEIVQSLLAPVLPDTAFSASGPVPQFLKRSAFEPGLAVCGRIHALRLSLDHLQVDESSLRSQVRNTLCQLGVIATGTCRVDPISEILQARYGVSANKSWRTFLVSEYVHALGLLKQAEATFMIGASFWLACQDSFNNAIYMALQKHFAASGHPAAQRIVGRDGNLVNYGSLLQSTAPFARHFPGIAACFLEMHDRRNKLPVAHPYETKTKHQTRYLRASERNSFVYKLRSAYADFVALLP